MVSNFKLFLNRMTPDNREEWLKCYRKKISLQHTPQRRKRSAIICKARSLGNHYRRKFFNKLPNNERIDYVRDFGEKVSIGILKNTEHMKRLRDRMVGNVFYKTWFEKTHPLKFEVYGEPSYNKSVLYFTGTPKFNPAINGRAKYLKYGLSSTDALKDIPNFTF